MGQDHFPKDWRRISIEFYDGSMFYLMREDLDRMDKAKDILEALSKASQIAHQLTQITMPSLDKA